MRTKCNVNGLLRTLCSVVAVGVIGGWLAGCSGGSSAASQARLDQLLTLPGARAVDLTRLSTGHATIQATINGVDGRFVLDTGAEATVLHAPRLARYRFDPAAWVDAEQGAGAGGVIEIRYYANAVFAVDDLSLPLPRVGSTDLGAVVTGLQNATGITIDGVVGQDVLVGMRGLIAVRQARLYLLPAHQCSSTAGAECAPVLGSEMTTQLEPIKLVRLSTGLLAAEMFINDVPGLFVVDSGSRLSYVHTGSLGHFGLSENDAVGSQSATSGAGGTLSVQTYRIDAARIADYSIRGQALAATDLSAVVDSLSQRANAEIHGVVGQDVLSTYDAIIDVAAGMLYLEQGSAAP